MKNKLHESAIAAAIEKIQQYMNDAGANIKVDGKFGTETAAAVLSNSKLKSKSNTLNKKFDSKSNSKSSYDDTRSTEFDTQFAMCKNLYDVLDGNADKFFKNFKGILNDREDAAQAWFAKAWKTAWGPSIASQLKSTNDKIKYNAKKINYVVDSFIKYIGEQHIGSAALTHTIELQHPNDAEQNESFKIRFDYM